MDASSFFFFSVSDLGFKKCYFKRKHLLSKSFRVFITEEPFKA